MNGLYLELYYTAVNLEHVSIPLRATSAEENTIKACFIHMDEKLLIGFASSIPVSCKDVKFYASALCIRTE